jgi:hypothetical protein
MTASRNTNAFPGDDVISTFTEFTLVGDMERHESR